MKHPSSREFYAYWDEKRAGAPAPDRSELEPGPMRGLLSDIFALSYDPNGGYPFRMAGARVCALLGGDVKGKQFSSFFPAPHGQEIEDIVGVVCEEKLAAVAGISATAANGTKVPLELLLLPFSSRAHTPLSLTGLLTAFEDGHENLLDLTLTSWRYMGHPPQRFAPRVLKKLAIARGFMVYEGLI